jgi:hypothetical protein
MSFTREFYRQQPIITFTGGAGFDFRVVITTVNATTLDGKITDLERLGPRNLVGWTNLVGTLAGFDGAAGLPAVITLDGLGDEGAIRVKCDGRTTWALQQAGLRAGFLTVLGTPPAGGRFRLAPMLWNLEPGSTSPLVGA